MKPPRAPAAPGSYAFRVHTRLDGTIISTVPSADVEACRRTCDETAGCVGYQYGGIPPLTSACQMFSAVTKRTVDTRWRSGVHSNLAVSLPVAYEGGPEQAQPQPKTVAASTPAKPAIAAVKSVVAPLRFGYMTRTHALVVGEMIKTGPADQPLSCLLMCMNTSQCTVSAFTPAPPGASQATGQGNCTAYRDVVKIEPDRPDGQTVIFKE